MAETSPARRRAAPAPYVPAVEFDAGTFRALVEIDHLRYERRTWTATPLVSDPVRVYERALGLALRVQSRRPQDPRGRPLLTARDVAHVAYAGMAVYAMDCYGWCYTYLARAAEKGVADLVREVSADLRLDGAERGVEALRRLAAASEPGQLVRFAELVETARALEGRLAADPGWIAGGREEQRRDRRLVEWAEYAARSVAAMGRLFVAQDTTLVEERSRAGETFGRLRAAADRSRRSRP